MIFKDRVGVVLNRESIQANESFCFLVWATAYFGVKGRY